MIRFAAADYIFQDFVNAAIWHDKCNVSKKKYVMVWIILKKISNEIWGKRSAIREANRWSSAGHHDDVIKWNHFPHHWPFVRGIHRSPVNYPPKGQWLGALMFSLFCAWINVWVNNREAGDLRRHRAYYDVIVMQHWICSFKQSVCNIIGREYTSVVK